MLRTLLKVEKPFRYLPVELNTIMKTPAPAMRRVALLFPDTYEMGMSHHGLQVLYELGNRIPDIWVERAFTPWPDMAELLRSSSNPPVTIESRTPLASMDVLAFSLMSELTYTNVLFTLEIAGIPILARERNSRHPLVVAGGACTANPLPLEPSIDAFAIGDGEIDRKSTR